MRGLWHAVYGRAKGSAQAQALTITAPPATPEELALEEATKQKKRANKRHSRNKTTTAASAVVISGSGDGNSEETNNQRVTRPKSSKT